MMSLGKTMFCCSRMIDIHIHVVQGVRGVSDRLPLHGGRGQVHLGRHGSPQCHGQPRDTTRQHSLQGTGQIIVAGGHLCLFTQRCF